MKVEDLIQLLKNRLNNFNLSRDYAVMNGDLERVNAADKEISALQDTLYQLNLLVDASESAAVKEASLTEIITDGSVATLGEYDITVYATDPQHEEKILDILSRMGVMDTAEKIDAYIKSKYKSSPVTGEMILTAAHALAVDARLMMALMELDSRFGTAGIATSTLNPGNIGNDDDGNTRTYGSWQEGVTAVAEWLSRHRAVKGTPVAKAAEPQPTATSTPQVTPPATPQNTSTTTPAAAATTTQETLSPQLVATSTPAIVIPAEPQVVATSTPETAATTTATTTTP